MARPKYPIFIFDGLDLIIISSAKELPVYVERPDDISEDEEIFDSSGRRVRLAAAPSKILGVKVGSRIVADIDMVKSVHIEEFVDKLRAFLRAVGDPLADNTDCDLSCLIEASRKHI